MQSAYRKRAASSWHSGLIDLIAKWNIVVYYRPAPRRRAADHGLKSGTLARWRGALCSGGSEGVYGLSNEWGNGQLP